MCSIIVVDVFFHLPFRTSMISILLMDLIQRICRCNWFESVLCLSKRSASNSEDQLNERSSSQMSRSPSNYCRVATCQLFHIHEITPKCLETYAPSSTYSSCQNCNTVHIGPNHNQLMASSWLSGSDTDVPNYNPQQSPEHTYRLFDFPTVMA